MSSVVLVGTYPPRRCGIATFTTDLREALEAHPAGLSCAVIAVETPNGQQECPSEVMQVIRQEVRADYIAAALQINASNAAVVCLQHEFGIFGGRAGAHILALAETLTLPLIVTLHTVLAKPYDADQHEALTRLAASAAKLVVMSERGREILVANWGVPRGKIAVVPHGGPVRPEVAVTTSKARPDRLLTFGLLGPDKGIETVIRAMPDILRVRPNTDYLVVGATHPNLVAREGEHYRETLAALADSLGVAERVTFQNGYVAKADLLRTIRDADLCVLPYLKEAHITSGTLAYAAALGKPVLATPFWHAQDLLGDDAGVLTPFADAGALAQAVVALLSDPPAREELGRRLGERVAGASWAMVACRYVQLFHEAALGSRLLAPGDSPMAGGERASVTSAPNLAGVIRMTDETGILQHSTLAVPNRTHGYCLDDNARALLLMHRLPGPFDPDRCRLARVFAAFVEHAWDQQAACMRNFMSYDRSWLKARGSDDSLGRAIWALAVTAVGPAPDLRHWAQGLLDRVAPVLAAVTWPRSDAFIILGLAELYAGGGASQVMRDLLNSKAARLAGRLAKADGDWLWFEDSLSYDNARLAEALIRAGSALRNADMVADGTAALSWLCSRQTSPAGLFRPVATADFGRHRALDGLFDQQPLEAAATVEACQAALEANGSYNWAREAERALAWYQGSNDLELSLLPLGGECYDGLQSSGVNLNQGAESILSLQFALCALQRIRAKLKDANVAACTGML